MNEGEVFPLNDDVALHLLIHDQMRRIIITREALEDFLRLSPSEASAIRPEQRQERVRKNLLSVVAAVNRKVDAGRANSEVIVIFAGEM